MFDPEAPVPVPDQPDLRSGIARRRLLRWGALGAGAAALAAACTQNSGSTATASSGGGSSSGTSLLDKWVSTKKATFGVDLTAPPLQFKDSSGKPTGYLPELLEMMMKDMGVTPEYVELPFPQLVQAFAAGGKFDMIGLVLTMLPSRALTGTFAGFPAMYESVCVLLKPGSTLTNYGQLNQSGVTITALQGSSEQFSGQTLFPKAQIQGFAQPNDAVGAVATGRADASISATFDVGTALKAYPNLKIMPGPPLFVDTDTWLLPAGDFKLYAWVTNWLRYQSAHYTMANLWNKWVGASLASTGLSTAVVGAGGEAVVVQNGQVTSTL